MAGSKGSEGYGTYIGPGSYDIGNQLVKGSAVLIYLLAVWQARPHAPTSVVQEPMAMTLTVPCPPIPRMPVSPMGESPDGAAVQPC